MCDEAKGWLVALVLLGIIIVSCCAITYRSHNKAFELGYIQVQMQGTTDYIWVKK